MTDSTQRTITIRLETYERLKLTSLTSAFPDGKPAAEDGWIVVPVGSRTLERLEGMGGSHDEALGRIIDRAMEPVFDGL